MPSMPCSNCGKSIPVEGAVCPFCQADKSADRAKYLAEAASEDRFYRGCGLIFVGGLAGGMVAYGIEHLLGGDGTSYGPVGVVVGWLLTGALVGWLAYRRGQHG